MKRTRFREKELNAGVMVRATGIGHRAAEGLASQRKKERRKEEALFHWR